MKFSRYLLIAVLFLGICFEARSQNEDLMELILESVRLRAESKYDSALFVCQRITDMAKDRNNLEYQARAALEETSIYILTNRYDFAYSKCAEAIKYSRAAKLKGPEMTAIYNKGLVKSRKEQFDSAIYFYNQSETYFRAVNDKDMLGVTLSGLASVLRMKNDRVGSIEKDTESALLYKETGQNQYLANRYFWIGEDYLVLDYIDSLGVHESYLDSAKYYYDLSLQLSDSLGFPDPKYRALRGLAVAFQREGELLRALNFMYESNNVTQNLFSNDIENKLLEVREKYNTANLEIKALQKERERNTVLIVAIAIVVAISIWLYVVDQRRKNIKAISEKNDQINKQKIDELLQEQEIASLQGVLEGQETERKRVAIDLHDRLGGILSMVKLHFSSVEEKIDPDNPSKEKFLTASELLDLAAGEVRNISHNMMSGVLAKFGLIPALEDLQSRISETGKLTVNLYTSNVNGALDGEQELQLYRIVQELMSNILKHSDATETNIQLNENEGSVNLIVEDDGIGFNPQKLDVKAGIGLNNLKARVAKLNGTLHIDSGLGAGTTVSIDIPVEND